MASNPMQKKSRNSFLLGMLLMFIIAAIIIAVIVFMFTRNNKKQKEEQVTETYVYRLKQDVKSGETIDSSMVESILVNIAAVPEGASASKTKSTDKNGKETWNSKIFSYDGYKSKIALSAGTILSDNMLYEGDELQASERIQEYNMLQLPMQLEPGEFVDVRIQLSNGQDFIVVSHKEVIDITLDTIWLQMKEEETVLMSSAIVDAYISPATKLYVSKYVEPGRQKDADVTYTPSAIVRQTIDDNPNIVDEAKTKLKDLYDSIIPLPGGVTSTYKDFYRSWLEVELNKYEEDEKLQNVEAKMIEAREKAQEAREQFLNGVK